MPQQRLIAPTCIACGSTDNHGRTFRTGPYELITCQRCFLGWVANPPEGDEFARLYSSGFYELGPARSNRLLEAGHAFNNSFRMRELRGLRTGRLLDIGSGRGRFLAAATAAGWDAVGIEFEPRLAQMSRERHWVHVVVGDATSAPVDGPFDVITLWHVLEHLPEPLAVVERVATLLAPGGRLIISVPNNDAWQARAGGDDWLHLDIPRHIYHFTPDSLTRLLARGGFRVERIGHLYPEMEVLGVLQTALNRLGLQPDLLYRFAKRDRAVTSVRDILVSLVAAGALLPFALWSAVVAPLMRSGASMQVIASRETR